MKSTQRPQRRLAARTGPGISLFPFLAVLICTMGALVPLLLAMMHTARVQAEAEAVAKASAAAAKHRVELQTQREDVQWRIEQLSKSRQQTQAQLADARLDLGHIEDHARRLRGELERYQHTVAELENIENADRQKSGRSQAELQQLRQQIEAARKQVEQARKEAADRPRSFAVVPYEGPNSTRRRPIYLECLADAVVIQPEGIRLTTEDFEGPMGPGNPLASALRAARERLLAESQFDPRAGEPYPLLLVRPEGIAAYYAAREAMRSWGCDFGYELIGNDWKLAYPPPNPQLIEVVRQAIASARINQQRLIAAAPREYPSHKKATYRASPRGGFVRDDGGSDGEDDGYRPARPAGAVGRNGGYGGTDTQPNATYNPYAALPERPGTTGSGSGGTVGLPGQYAGSAGQYNPNANTVPGSGGTVGSPGQYTGSAGQYNPNANTVPGGGGTIGSPGQYAGSPGQYSPNATGPERRGTAVPGGGGASNGNLPGNGGGNGNGMSSSGGGVPQNPVRGGSGAANGVNPYVTNPQGSEAANAGTGGTRSGTPGARGVASGGSSLPPSQPSDRSQNNGPSVERPDGYVVGQPAREAPSAAARNSQQPAEGGVPRVLRPGEWEPTPEPPPKFEDKKDDSDKKHHKPPRSLAERRGEDWGLRDASAGSVGVTRPIRIGCYADRLVVVSDRNPADSKVIQLRAHTASSIDAFVSAIWGHIEGWGIAGRGMYWRPVLQVWVAPGGEERFTDLAALLDGSGLAVKRR
jgi:hypothetical protein